MPKRIKDYLSMFGIKGMLEYVFFFFYAFTVMFRVKQFFNHLPVFFVLTGMEDLM